MKDYKKYHTINFPIFCGLDTIFNSKTKKVPSKGRIKETKEIAKQEIPDWKTVKYIPSKYSRDYGGWLHPMIQITRPK